MGVMRSTLLGGLINILRFNLNRKHERVRIFEIGCCFSVGRKRLHCSRRRIAGLCYGGANAEQWGEAVRQVDFYDAKADVEALCYPAESALCRRLLIRHCIRGNRHKCHWMEGDRLDRHAAPAWQQKYDLPQPAVMFELELPPLAAAAAFRRFSEISKFPPVRRDLAVVVEEGVNVQTLLDGMRKHIAGVRLPISCCLTCIAAKVLI